MPTFPVTNSNLRPVGIRVKSVGMYVPDKILTNEDLERMVDTSDEWITERTGIKRRHIVDDPNVSTSDLAAWAAESALKRVGEDPANIDLVLVGTATPDYMFPATACITQAKIGANNAFAFDLEAGCSSFIYALSVATGYLKSGMIRKALVIGADTLSRVTNWKDRSTCILFGDGAGAFLLEADEENTQLGPIAFDIGSDGNYAELITLPAGGAKLPASEETVKNDLHYLQMRGREVFRLAVTTIEASLERLLGKAGLKIEDISVFIFHQANLRIIDAAIRRFGIPKEKAYVNIQEYGNTSSASIPIAFYEVLEKGLAKPGDKVLMMAFGAGFTWGGVIWQL